MSSSAAFASGSGTDFTSLIGCRLWGLSYEVDKFSGRTLKCSWRIMDTNILAAIIGGGATIVAAVITIRASRRRSARESQNSIGHSVTERSDAKKVPQTHIVD